jgi:hypothetical protein
MPQPIILIGRESFLGNKLYERLNLEGKVIVPLGSAENNKNSNTIPWNRSSRISAKTAVRELKRLHGMPDEVFIVFGRKRNETFPDMSVSFIEETIDNDLKGLFYITQELYQTAFQESGETAFYFISEQIYDAKKPVSSAVTAGFKAYAEAVMSANQAFYMAGFELESDDDEGFLNFILKTSSTRAAKKRNTWNIYPRGSRLFGIGS